jgi:hypothetical protein
MNGDEKWFVCLLNLVELFTITVFVHTVGIAAFTFWSLLWAARAVAAVSYVKHFFEIMSFVVDRF